MLGPIKIDAFMGKLSGNQFPPRPLFHGEKVSFKPTANLEFSFSRTGEFGGVGRPVTFGSVFNTYFALKSSFDYGVSDNPGPTQRGIRYILPDAGAAQLADGLCYAHVARRYHSSRLPSSPYAR